MSPYKKSLIEHKSVRLAQREIIIHGIKEKGGERMEVTISVSERDTKRIVRLGSIPWTKITYDEKKEYEHLVGLYGALVCLKILHAE